MMPDARRVADRYIERGGYLPGEREQQWPDDLLCVASFIAWHDDNALWGGYRADDAFRSLCRLLNLSSVELRNIIRGESPDV